jgi:hypothetical protein
VPVVADPVVELDETVGGVLSVLSAEGRDVIFQGKESTLSIDGTILNDDSAVLSVNDVTLPEGDSDATNFVFEVTLDTPVDIGFNVTYATGTDTTDSGDFTLNFGEITFAGTVSEMQTVTVAVTGDELVEVDETFFLNLIEVLGAGGRDITFASGGQGTGFITNDDAGAISISDVAVAEGDDGETDFIFTVSSDAALDQVFSVDYSTAFGTATAEDITATSGTLILLGNLDESRTFTVKVTGDELVELDESFFVNLSNVQANGKQIAIGDGQGEGTITNNDEASILLTGGSVVEGDDGVVSVTYTATLSAEVDVPVLVNFATSDGTAVAAEDYTETSTTATAVTTEGVQFTVPVTPENLAEVDESIVGTLSALDASGRAVTFSGDAATLAANATIENDDFSPVGNEDGIYNVIEDQVLNVASTGGVLINDTDADDGDGVANLTSVSVADDVDNGTSVLNEDGSFTYTPNPDYHGDDSFTYLVSDGTNSSQGVANIFVEEGTPPADDGGFQVLRTERLANGDMLIAIASTPGATYAIEYSEDMVNWTRVEPTVVANANRLQWTDNGPPKTVSHPSTVTNRYYRFVLISTAE